jgi:hypothetical protein
MLFDTKKADRSMRMKVAPVAKVLSNKMVRKIDHVANNPSVTFAQVPLDQRTRVLAPVRQLCKQMNRWFDLCNSNDPDKRGKGNDKPVWVTTNNAIDIADEFLSILAWIEEWKASLTVNGRLRKEHFIPIETYKSLQQCCYGFASMIYYWVVGQGRMLVLKRINQDMCAHHFGHVRTQNGYCPMPIESNANAAGKVSCLKRTVGASKSANVKMDLKSMELA